MRRASPQVTARALRPILCRVTPAPARERLKARLALLWEAAAPIWAPPALVAGLLAAAGAWGLLAGLPPLARALVGLTGLSSMLFLAWRGARAFAWPDDRAVFARLQADSGLSEAGAFELLADRPAGADPVALALWDAARARAAMQAATARAGRPRAALARIDPFGLRLLLPAALLLAAAIEGPHAFSRAGEALQVDFGVLAGDRPLRIEVWATPPDYTGLPPIRLSGREGDLVRVPEGAILSARVDGAAGAPVLAAPGALRRLAGDPREGWRGSAPILRDGWVSVRRFGVRARWRVALIADAPPSVALTARTEIRRDGRLALSWRATDDYAVTAALLRLTLVDPPEGLADAPPRDVALPILAGRSVESADPLDLAADPWAGLAVKAALVVRDGKGQEAASPAQDLTLPERAFTSPMARAIIEQRQMLLREARPYGGGWRRRGGELAGPGETTTYAQEDRLERAPPGVRRAQALLAAFLREPESYFPDRPVFLALVAARARIEAARSIEEAHRAGPLLWQAALRAEAGPEQSSQSRLDAARDALSQALREGASQQELRALMDRLREAMAERLKDQAQAARARADQGDQGDQGGDGESLSAGDLEDMLNQLEDAAATGARGEAQALLDQLAGLMAGLSVQLGEGGQGGEGDRAIQALQDALQRQRDLSDETFRRRQDGADTGDLAQRQQALREEVQGQAQGDGDDAARQRLEEAGKAMDEAAEALRRGDAQAAGEAQSRAQQALRSAADALARAQAERRRTQGRDPLGRLTGPSGSGDGEDTRVPTEAERQRARDILEELRRRSADPQRDREEQEYLNRLLDRL